MTERKPPGIGFESWVDQQIREATERGEFDNLPGAGKPIPGQGEPHDEMWWVKGLVRREGLAAEGMLPTSLRLRKDVEDLPETVRGVPTERAVRDVGAKLNARIEDWLRAPTGPYTRVDQVDEDAVVRQWSQDRPTRAPAEPPPGKPRRWWRR